MRLLRGEEEEEVEYYVLSCIPLQHCCFFLFSSGRTLMLYPLTFVVPAAMFHKHRMGNILSIRNLDRCFPPATLHSARARSHSPSPSAEVLSFLSHASDTFKHLTISAFLFAVSYIIGGGNNANLALCSVLPRAAEIFLCQVLFQDKSTRKNKKLTCIKRRGSQVFNFEIALMIEREYL